MAGKRADGLREQMFFIERFTLNRAWTDLTDDEFLWLPTPGAYTVQPREQCKTPTPWVVGDWTADFDTSLPVSQEPLTSIAWLYWHVGSMPGRAAELDFLGGEHTAESGWTSPYSVKHPIFTTADEAVTTMQAGWRALRDALKDATDERLEAPTRFWGYGGPGPMATGATVLASILNEVSHHGTQIGVLRDFYRVRTDAR